MNSQCLNQAFSTLALLTHGARKFFAGLVLFDDLEGLDWWWWGVPCEGGLRSCGGLYVYIQLIHMVVQQKINRTPNSNYIPIKKNKN